MYNSLTLFVDVIASDDIVKKVKKLKKQSPMISNVNVTSLTSLEFSSTSKDLLIWDIRIIPCGAPSLTLAKTLYDEVILIGLPDDENVFGLVRRLNINLVLRANYYPGELTNLLTLYLQKVTLKMEKVLLNKLFESAQNSIVMTDIDGNIQYANSYFENISGYRLEELISKSPRLIKSDLHDKKFYEELWQTITTGKTWEGIFINLSKDETFFYEEATITPVMDNQGNIEKFLKIGKNITRERLLLDQLSHEVKLAISVLDALLPSKHIDSNIHFDYYMAHYNEIGGDFIYFKQTRDNVYHFAILDVMGHGVSSALIALTLAQMFGDYTKFQTLENSVNALNNMMTNLNAENIDNGRYVTGIFAELNIDTNSLSIINAGHPDTILELTDGSVKHLSSNNMLLGVMPFEAIDVYNIPLNTVHKMLTFTDGLFESNHVNYDRALRILDESLVHLGNEKFFESVMHSFTKSKIIEDDITLCKIVLNDLHA